MTLYLFVAVAIYAMANALVYAGNSPHRIMKWIKQNPKQAVSDFIYNNAFFYFSLAVIAIEINIYIALISFIAFIVVGLINKPAEYKYGYGEAPPRFRLPLEEDQRP